MKLEYQNCLIEDVKFSDTTRAKNKTLSINKDELIDFLKDVDFVTEISIDLAKPGEKTRIIPVKDCIEPKFRVGRTNEFPDVTGEIEQFGDGITKIMKNVAVVTVGDAVDLQEGIVDMWGEGADYTPFSKALNVVVDIRVQKDIGPHEHETCARFVGLKSTEYLGYALENVECDNSEISEIQDIKTEAERLKDLPGVVYIQIMIAQGLLHDVYIYGIDVKKILPTLPHPNKESDDAVVSGNCVAICDKITTCQHRNNSVVKELYKGYGKTINFVGEIMVPELTTLDGKFRTCDYTVKLCKILTADGVVTSEESYGNPDPDLVMIFSGLEKAGVKSVLITDECARWAGDSQPLADVKKEACVIVSTGNVSHLVHLDKSDKIIGNVEAIKNLAGGWDGCLDEEKGTIVCELNAITGSTSEIEFHNLTVKLY